MDKEQEKEYLSEGSKEEQTEHSETGENTKQTEKEEEGKKKEEWTSIYSREKKLEELRRKRMEAASASVVGQNKEEKTVVIDPEDLKKKSVKWFERWKEERQMQKKRHLDIKTEVTQSEYLKYRIREWVSAEWKSSPFALVLAAAVILFCGSMIYGAAGGETNTSQTEAKTETERIYPEIDITVGSTGCMLLHSPFIDSYPDAQGNYDFSSIYKYITPYYSEPDFMTCEFEGCLGGEELGYSGYPLFISPDVIIENIRDSGVDLQFLATNHVYDGGSAGFHRTMDVYEKEKIAYTGARPSESVKPYIVEDIKGVEVGFINYVYETNGEGKNLNGLIIQEEDWNLLNTFDYNNLNAFYEDMEQQIASMKADGARFIIAQMHWGIEYQLQEADYQDEIAQTLCDLGVNAIIGGHPHCEQPVDVLEKTDGSGYMFCIYSEGNALSNQRTYLMDEMPTGHTEDGVMITLDLHQNTDGAVEIKDIEMLPTWVYRYSDVSGSKYYILPLDDVENIEKLTGISDIKEEAQASRERTLEELEPGMEKVRQIFGHTETENNTASQTKMIEVGIE